MNARKDTAERSPDGLGERGIDCGIISRDVDARDPAAGNEAQDNR